jgi:oleandomycin transport system ATP-binding protein
MNDAAIEASGLVKHFGKTVAVDGVDLVIPRGRVLGLLGPNGAGKTTTVRMLATLTRPDAGTARVGGYDVIAQAHEVRSRIGLTGQFASVDDRLTGSENLFLIGRLLGLARPDARSRAGELLRRFQLEEAADRPAQGYSGGMRRRLDLAASLVGEPEILFLDEPSTGLDPRARRQLWTLVRELVADGVTVLLTTQYLDEADTLADEIVVIDHGRVIAAGTPETLKRKIGARTLLLGLVDATRLDQAETILAHIAGQTPECQGERLSVRLSEHAMLPALLRALDESGIEVDELVLKDPSLDEVFLALTGQPVMTAPETEATSS